MDGIASKNEIYGVLRQFNPWWQGKVIPGIPEWKRSIFTHLEAWVKNPEVHRAILLNGPRQVGKTTLLMQVINSLLNISISPSNILYATFDHPLLKNINLEELIDIWKEFETSHEEEIQYLFLDEIQYMNNWQTSLKHQVDFEKKRRIVVTGSAVPLITPNQESGVGRWHIMKLGTLSFYEYLKIKNITLPKIDPISSLSSLFEYDETQFIKMGQEAKVLLSHFNEYLIRGGFPQSVQIDNISLAQKLIREDIIDKILKRDMTALFGVRRVFELEQTFLYLCMHDRGLLDIMQLCKNLELNKSTVNHFLELFESGHLIYRLAPYGYGKEVLRGRFKVYLADSSIASSLLLKGKSLLEDPKKLGCIVESVFLKHLLQVAINTNLKLSYWGDKEPEEIDIIVEGDGSILPFEVKYRAKSNIEASTFKRLNRFCEKKGLDKAYLITKDLDDFGVNKQKDTSVSILRIPALLACYWLSTNLF